MLPLIFSLDWKSRCVPSDLSMRPFSPDLNACLYYFRAVSFEIARPLRQWDCLLALAAQMACASMGRKFSACRPLFSSPPSEPRFILSEKTLPTFFFSVEIRLGNTCNASWIFHFFLESQRAAGNPPIPPRGTVLFSPPFQPVMRSLRWPLKRPMTIGKIFCPGLPSFCGLTPPNKNGSSVSF